MPTYGGCNTKCVRCDKTCYPAETISFEKKPYHFDCFRCEGDFGGDGKVCNKKMEGAANASAYDGKLYCQQCFKKGGFAQKQRNVKWTKSASTGSNVASKFGGGGTKCFVCEKTVYQAEAISYEKKVFHQDCFLCVHEIEEGKPCGAKLTTSSAKMFDDKLYCGRCFTEGGYLAQQAKVKSGTTKTTNALASKFGGGGQKCVICDKTVYAAETVSFEKKVYHPSCFVCSVENCKKKMTCSDAKQFEGALFCGKCWTSGGYSRKQAQQRSTSTKSSTGVDSRFAKFGGGGTKCKKCEKTVYPAETVSFEKMAFHSACFTCDECDKKLTPSAAEYHKADGSIHCKPCFQSKGLHRA